MKNEKEWLASKFIYNLEKINEPNYKPISNHMRLLPKRMTLSSGHRNFHVNPFCYKKEKN